MARMPLNTRVADYQPSERMPAVQPLQDIQRPGGQADETIFQVSSKLAEAVGQVADDLAKNEGKRAGMVAGADPNFRPSNNPTLRGRAFDAAATDVYLSKLQAQFQTDAVTTYERHKDDPAGFKTAMDKLHQDYSNRHVWPEVAGYFDTSAMKIANSLRQSVAANYDTRRKDENRASLIEGINATDNNRSRLLAVNPESPETEAAIMKMRDENILRIQSEANAGTTSQEQAAKLIADERNKAWQDVLIARAQRLTDPAQVAQFREQVRKQYGEGKYEGFSNFEAVDAKLVQYQNGLTTKRSAAIKELNTQISGFLDRFADGRVPPVTEWMTLEQAAREAGPEGVAAINQARAKLAIRVKMSALPLDEAEAYVRSLEKQGRENLPGAPGAFTVVDVSGNKEPPNFRSMDPGTQENAKRLAEAFGQNIRITPHGGTQADKRASTSQHHHGRAIDILIADMPEADRTRLIATAVAQGARGFGAYSAGSGVGTIHIDWREGAGNGPQGLAVWHRVGLGKDEGLENAPGWFQEGIRQGLALRAQGGMPKGDAELIKDARAALEARRTIVNTDPLLAAEREGRISQIAAIDFGRSAQELGGMVSARVAQAEAVSEAYRRPPQYIRTDEKQAAKAILAKGGDKALELISGVVQGAGARAPAVLKEIADDAPAMAHAGQVLFQTGDRAFARQVAEAQQARTVPGAKPPTPAPEDVNTAMRETIGHALTGMSPDERERTRAAATLWAEAEFARRNMDPKASGAAEVIKEAVQRARGRTGSANDAFGGLTEIRAGGWGSTKVQVQAPSDVRPGMFQQVLGAITDDDIKGMSNPPVDAGGNPMPAKQVRRYLPFLGPDGYRFGAIDPITGIITPLKAKDGRPFTLDFDAMRPQLRERVPGAFR